MQKLFPNDRYYFHDLEDMAIVRKVESPIQVHVLRQTCERDVMPE